MNAEQFERASLGIDVFIIPPFGVVFALFSGIPLLLGRMRVNGQVVNFADEPLKFYAALAIGLAVGVLCCLYGWLRYRWHRKSKAT